jgi:predicted metalloendopeptidase
MLIAVLVALSSFAPVLARQAPPEAGHGINPADMDLSVDPASDFYRFANGGWLDRTPIPADEGRYGVFNEVYDRTTAQLLDLMGRLAEGGQVQGGTDEWKAVEMFRQGTDLATRNAQGVEPIRPTVDEIDAIRDLTGVHQFLEGSTFRGINGLVPIQVFPGLEDSTVNVTYLGGPYLGLPNRDYYLEEAPGNAEVRAAYVDTAAKLLGFLGYDDARARPAAQAVYDLERRLAEPTLTREEQQDFSLFNNPTAVADLATRYPLMDWPGYLETLGLKGIDPLIVTETRYLDALPAIVESTPVDVLKDYLKLELLWGASGTLSEEIEATAFAFQGGVLGGVQEQRPIAERSLETVNFALGEAVGKLYVEAYFPPEAKAQIETLVAELIRAYRLRLEANPWMTPETKATALAKLDKFRVKVGYPDRFRSYGAVAIEDSYAGTVLNALNAETRRLLQQAGKPVDKEEWGLPPQTVNAFYNPQNNEIVFPAGILQAPFFDYRADPASNYGAIGFVIGHEITHGFDIGGSQFDADGNLVNWWSEADTAAFQALNGRVVAQYDAIEVLPGVTVDGQITVGENVADLGGLQVAHDALMNALGATGVPPLPQTEATPIASPISSPVVEAIASPPASPAVPPIASPVASPAAIAFESLTQEQRFFVAAATVWHEVTRDEALRTQVQTDSHSPAQVRGTRPLQNMDEFHAAFGIEPGDAIYLPPEERVVVW